MGLILLVTGTHKSVGMAKGMDVEEVRRVVDKAVEKPLLGIFGTEKVNVLKLNIALEEADAPNVYVSVFLVKGADLSSLAHHVVSWDTVP